MRIVFHKVAVLLFGFVISLKCNAADESAPSSNASSTLLSPTILPSQVKVTDGMQKFHELFHLNDNDKISYKVTVDYPPNAALADSLDKQWAAVKDPLGINRMASLKAYSQRLRKGSQSVSIYTLYISKAPMLMLEKVGEDESNKGYDTKVYFTAENITEVEPSAGIVTVFPRDVNRYIGLLNNFPLLYSALGYTPDKLDAIIANAPIFVVLNKGMAAQFILKLDSSQSLAETDEISSVNKKLRVTKFEYSAQSHLWPSSIKADDFGADGTLQGREQWDLLKIENLPDGFDFSPKIEPTYRVVDKTASKIPSEEIHNLINQ